MGCSGSRIHECSPRSWSTSKNSWQEETREEKRAKAAQRGEAEGEPAGAAVAADDAAARV